MATDEQPRTRPASGSPLTERGDDASRREVMRVWLIVMEACLSILTVMVLLLPPEWSGPVLVTMSAGHGLHMFDVPALLVWLLGSGAVVGVWRAWR
ncbi:hypothetical protein [Nocardioides acrostichi]|uniref:Uncharacterized protein n=1 Tax=Nocardioides acrostichi TaxID=2784339 RepID=A0A930V4T4_9ACTN|nr:hypothetical protein [Nocardioides acrostichi]MBF4163994.1 hypothetical protein [Nocardioides acrostichi]